jgi:hypothetical protein
MLTITDSIIDHNQAQGGSADTSGPASNGGEGAGGGVYNTSGSTITVTDSSITHNLAIGASGSNGGNGGNGLGGGFYNEGTASLESVIIEYNLALGGDGGQGGNGLGGGLYNGPLSNPTLTRATVEYNLALGGAGSGGTDGQGIGGGLYLVGTLDPSSKDNVITKNHASTSGDDIGP